MGNGHWTRWGRGSCEGYGLEIGSLLRFSIVAEGHSQPNPIKWTASLNAMTLGEFPTFEEAVTKSEFEARMAMRLAIEDLDRLNAAPPAKRRQGRNRK